jgi:hypothetical protein
LALFGQSQSEKKFFGKSWEEVSFIGRPLIHSLSFALYLSGEFLWKNAQIFGEVIRKKIFWEGCKMFRVSYTRILE